MYLIYDKITLKVCKRIFHPKRIKIENIVNIKGQCTVKQVATALELSERRVKQIKKEVKENGVIFKNKQKINLEPAYVTSETQDYTYGEIFANKIQLFFSEIFKNYCHYVK